MKLFSNPKFLISVGIGCIVGAVGASIAGTVYTMKDIEKNKDKIEELKEKAVEAAEGKTKNEIMKLDETKELGKAYIRRFAVTALSYAPAAALTFFGIKFCLGSYDILKKQNIALAGTVTSLTAVLNKVKDNVIADQGEDKWLEYRYGIKKEEIEEVDENGKSKKVKDYVISEEESNEIPEIIFDESCSEWTVSRDYCETFLKVTQETLTMLLPGVKTIVLNEFFDMIGHPRTEYGSVVGWTYGKGDDQVDLRMTPVRRKDEFGRHQWIYVLDPNTDGVVIGDFEK